MKTCQMRNPAVASVKKGMKRMAALLSAVACAALLAACSGSGQGKGQTTDPPHVSIPQDVSTLPEAAAVLKTPATLDNLLELNSIIARDYAAELEPGIWDVPLDTTLWHGLEPIRIVDTEHALTDSPPEEMLHLKYVAVKAGIDQPCLLGSFLDRLPESCRAASVSEAEAVLYVQEQHKERTDYNGKAYNCVYDIFIWKIGGDTVWKIGSKYSTPPLFGREPLYADPIPMSELWPIVQNVFFTDAFDETDESGSVMSFRKIGDHSCRLTKVTPAEGITEVRVPEKAGGLRVAEIGGACFGENSTIESVILPHGLDVICDFAFSGCFRLARVDLPDTLKVLGKDVFDDCISLRDIRIPDSVIRIGHYLLSGCDALESVRIPGSVEVFDSVSFTPRDGRIARLVFAEGVTTMKEFPNSTVLACCYLPASLTSLCSVRTEDNPHAVFYAPDGSYAMKRVQELGFECVACEREEDMPPVEYVTEGSFGFRLFNGEAALSACLDDSETVNIPDMAADCPVTGTLPGCLSGLSTGKTVVVPAVVRYIGARSGEKQVISDLYITDPETSIDKEFSAEPVIHAPEDSLARQFAETNGNPFETWTP